MKKDYSIQNNKKIIRLYVKEGGPEQIDKGTWLCKCGKENISTHSFCRQCGANKP